LKDFIWSHDCDLTSLTAILKRTRSPFANNLSDDELASHFSQMIWVCSKEKAATSRHAPKRRKTMKTLSVCLVFVTILVISVASAADRPNVLWITSEDNGPHIGAFGDEYADTPNLDRLAAMGTIFANCWSTAPVCAPARTTLISGLYPPCTGAEHMRSITRLPANMKMYPQFLREAGYYCTNKTKEDYNLEKPGQVWDGQGTWRDREPGQSFFSVINFTTSHESQLRKRPHTLKHDPSKVKIPAYHPDTPEVRHDWAQYHDKITEMDAQVGKVLDDLEADGLMDDTIIFYYGDHGSGMPRSKRWPYNSGLNVPLIVRVPEKYQKLAPEGYKAGGKSDQLVGFIDFAPTLLSIVGIQPPDWIQGHAFMGEFRQPAQPYAFGFRGRMDERYDMVRVVRDKRYIYIRNFMPHKIYGQFIAYMFQTPTTRVWKQLYDERKLNTAQSSFWQAKPAEELYDLQNDPDEVHNLAVAPEHRSTVERFQDVLRNKLLEIRDVGFLPEAEIHARSKNSTPYEYGHNRSQYPLERIMTTAELASSLEKTATPQLLKGFSDEDSAVRYWAAMGMLMRREEGIEAGREQLLTALGDSSPSVRVIAAQALGEFGNESDAKKALEVLLDLAPIDQNGVYISMLAINAIDHLDDRAIGAIERIRALPKQADGTPGRMRSYVPNLITKTLADLGATREQRTKKQK
jgi:uncharacterized sulfatase